MRIGLDGVITFLSGQCLSLGMTRDSVHTELGGVSWDLALVNPPYCAERMKVEEYIVVLRYKNDCLVGVEIALEETGKTWGDWSVESLREQKAAHDRLVMDWIGGTKRVFDWGSVASVLDMKSGSSCIILLRA